MATKPIDSNADTASLSSADDGQRTRRLKLTDLLGSGREAVIEHDGHDYHLRITSKGKLILTK